MSALKPLPYYKWFWQDFRASRKVQRMTYIERGLYRSLLDECWSEGGIPSDLESLAEICDCPLEVMADAWQVLSKCFELRGKVLVNIRLDSERTEKDSQRVNRAEAGRRGGLAKLNKASPVVADAKQVLSTCHIEEKRREEKKKRKTKEKILPPEEFLPALEHICSSWPKQTDYGKGPTKVGRLPDPGDLWERIQHFFPDDDPKVLLKAGIAYLDHLDTLEKDFRGHIPFVASQKNFYGTEAKWKEWRQ